MKVLIIRPFPSVVTLKSNSYNQQEIGLADGFLQLGHSCKIVYFDPTNNHSDFFKTNNGVIDIQYIKGKRVLKNFSFLTDFDDLKKEADLIVVDEYAQFETYRTIKDYSHKTIIYNGPYYSKTKKLYNSFVGFFDFAFLSKYKRLNPTIVTKSRKSLDYLQSKGLKVESFVGVGLDLNQLRPVDLPAIDGVRKQYNLLYVGRLEKRRNILFLIDVLGNLVSENKQFHLTIIGTGDTKYLKKVFSLIRKKRLENNITYIEKIPQKDLADYYLRSNWFLLPTSYEIWGMVLMEAMYYGCKVLTTDNGGSSSLIKNGLNGFVENINKEKWAEIILKDAELPKRVSNHLLIQSQFEWKGIAAQMISAFERHSGE